MSDFLNFLNTTDLDTLTQAPGITQVVAENLIAARPFNSVDECLKVKGMSRALRGKLELFAETQGYDSENRAMIPVMEDALPALIEKSQPAQESVKDQPSFFSRLRRAFTNFLRAMLKLIVVAALIGVIGAALYYAIPYFNKAFIAPVEQNSAQIDKLESEIFTLQTQLAEMTGRVDALETSVETHTLSIQKLEEIQNILETQLQTNSDKALLELKHEVMTTRALDMLARARLYLAQSNFGLAKVDLQSARDLLFELQGETGEAAISLAIARLDLALGNLPDFPVVASGDLEIAWQILITGRAIEPTAFTPAPLLSETFTPTPAPPPSVEATSTP